MRIFSASLNKHREVKGGHQSPVAGDYELVESVNFGRKMLR
jgi:hypothetical protein